ERAPAPGQTPATPGKEDPRAPGEGPRGCSAGPGGQDAPAGAGDQGPAAPDCPGGGEKGTGFFAQPDALGVREAAPKALGVPGGFDRRVFPGLSGGALWRKRLAGSCRAAGASCWKGDS